MGRGLAGAVGVIVACSGAAPSAPAIGSVSGDVAPAAQPVTQGEPDPGRSTPPDAPWAGTRIVSSPTWNDVTRVRLAAGGDMLVAGSTLDTFGPDDATAGSRTLHGFLAWLSPEGSLERTLSLDMASGESLGDVAVAGDGTLWVAGWFSAGGGGGYLAHRDAAGALLERLPPGAPGTSAVPFALALAPGGDLVAAGDAGPGVDPSNPDGRGAWLGRFDAGGKLRWQVQPTTDPSSYFSGVAIATSGDICVSGLADGRTLAACFDPAGRLEWRLDLVTAYHDEPAVVADPRGGVYLAGTTSAALTGAAPAGATDAFVANVDGAGAVRWIRTIATADHDFAHGLAADPAGGVIVVGHVTGADMPGVAAHGFAARLDDGGALAWDTPIALGSYAFAAAVAVDAAGGAVVAGSRQRPDTIARDGFVARLTAGGEVR